MFEKVAVMRALVLLLICGASVRQLLRPVCSWLLCSLWGRWINPELSRQFKRFLQGLPIRQHLWVDIFAQVMSAVGSATQSTTV